jgi:hypothetical protein
MAANRGSNRYRRARQCAGGVKERFPRGMQCVAILAQRQQVGHIEPRRKYVRSARQHHAVHAVVERGGNCRRQIAAQRRIQGIDRCPRQAQFAHVAMVDRFDAGHGFVLGVPREWMQWSRR